MLNEKELAEFVAKLPEHLRFFFEEPPEGLEDEELIAFMQTRLAKVREHFEELKAHGVAADRFLAEAEPTLEEAVQAVKAVEEHQDKLLHLHADVAEAQAHLVRTLLKAVRNAEEHNPFHPDLPEWREQLEELAKQYPKE